MNTSMSLTYGWVRVIHTHTMWVTGKLQMSPCKTCCSLTSFHSYSSLPLIKYKPNSTHITVKQCTLCLNAHNFIFNHFGLSPGQSHFNKFKLSHFISSKAQTHNIQSKLKNVGKQASSIASLFLLTFLLQQVQLPTCSAIIQILNSDFQSSLPTNMYPKDSQAIPTLRNNSSNVIDTAKVLSPDKAIQVEKDLQALQDNSDWKIRVLTRTGPSPSPSDKSFRDLWQPDDRTVIIVEDISSPNILNFGTGLAVASRLPRQFFIELQSRYGNQFFVSEEGHQAALLNTIDAIRQCIVKEDGCNNVPGLTNDLYFLTLATSIAGGAVFGFAARLSPQGRVEGSWQWIVVLSPLWLLLFVSFGVLPIVGRTSDWEPLLKNILGFLGTATAFYLTPIFGKSPIGKNQ